VWGPVAPARLVALVAWLGGAAAVWLWWRNTPYVARSLDEWLVDGARITGLLAGYLVVLVVLLMARVPFLERRVGTSEVARWHASLGRYVVGLVVAHVVLSLVGYAMQLDVGVVRQAVSMVTTYPSMVEAVVATALLLFTGIVSAVAVRRRLSYTTWHRIHLVTYAAVYLGFWHQVENGAELVDDATARWAWTGLYAAAALALVWYRLLVPLRLNLRHRLRVVEVVREAPGVVSVVVRGHGLDSLGAQPGQFMRWRFLAPGMWWSANPYSLSAAPQLRRLRITVKSLGGHSRAISRLAPGTPVWATGPFGGLTARRRTRAKVLLVAAGAGITPLRALYETLPARPGELTLLYRASRVEDLALWDELCAIAADRGARLLHAVNGADGMRPDLTAGALRGFVPDLAAHDVYVCGPQGFAARLYHELRRAGVPDRQVHYEGFEL
jgi:predicted ferric reductase